MAPELDSLDWRIIHLLGEDAGDLGRAAAELECEREELDRRLAALRDRGVIGEVVARIRPETVGLPVTAFLLLRVVQTHETYDAVAKLLRDMEHVEEAHAVTGAFDWLVKVRAEGAEDVERLVTERLPLLPGFVRAQTMVVLRTASDRVNAHAVRHPR